MDPSTRVRLAERRRMLQLRRRRAEISVSFRRVAASLCSHGVRCTKLMPARIGRVLGTLASGPGEDEELDLSWVPGAEKSHWSTREQRDLLCRWALAAVARDEEDAAVIWHTAKAGARLKLRDLRAHLPLLLDEGNGGTTWLVSASGGSWLIQVGYWSRTVAYAADIPARPAAAPGPGRER